MSIDKPERLKSEHKKEHYFTEVENKRKKKDFFAYNVIFC